MMKKSFLLTAIVLLSFLIPLTGWGQTYNLATSLSVGDEVVLVNTGVTKELGSITTSGTTYGTAVDVTNSTPAGTNQLTVVAGTSEGSFAFKTSGGKYLSWSSGNSLTTATSVTNASSWTVSFSEGVATIANVGTSDRKLRYNSSSPRFACYTTSQTAVKLYKKESGGSTAVATTTSIDASGITNTDVYTSTAAGSLSATVTETESGNAVSGATVTWTSSDEGVATIDENGVVTLVAAGTTTITASYAGVTDEFRASSDTYELTVTNSAPIIEITPNYEFWGQTAQFSGNTYSELSGEKDNVTLEWTRGNGSTYANTTAMRFYKDNTLTFTAPDGYEIKSIVITFSTTQTDLSFSPEGYSLSGTTGTWTGSSATVTMTRPSDASNYAQITKYTITLGEPSTDPIINASNTNIAYDATSGEIAYTITNPVTGKTLQATADADWVSNIEVGAEAITFTTTANEANTERVATFTLTYEGAEDKTVTVTQAASPVVYSTIPALFQAATSTVTDVNVQFNNWVVTGVSTNGRNVFVTDGTNGFAIYDGSGSLASTYAVGNTLAGLASCKLKLQNGYAQLQDVNAADLTIGTGGSVDFATITMADLAGINTGALVQYDNLTCSVDDSGTTPKYYLTDGTTTLQVYNTLYADALTTLEEGKVYNIKGVYQQYSKTKEILPRDANDIEEVIKPTITVDPSEVNVGYEAGNGTLSLTYENFEVTGAADFEIVFCDAEGNELQNRNFTTFSGAKKRAPKTNSEEWLTAEVVLVATGGYAVSYSVAENTVEIARTEYFKVMVGNVESNVVTVTQDAFVPKYTVTFNTDGGTFVPTDVFTSENVQVEKGKYALPMATKDGFKLQGWNDGNMEYAAGSEYDFTDDVEFTAVWVEKGAEEWVLTDITELAADDVFVIVGNNGSNNYAMSNDNGTSNPPVAVAVTVENDKITSDVADNIQWNIEVGTNGYIFHPNGDDSKWLYCNTNSGSGSNNNIRVGTGDRKTFVLDDDGYLITNDSYVDRYMSIYVNNGTPQDWRGYINTTNAVAMTFYKKVETLVPTTATITIKNGFTATTFSCDKALDFTGVTGVEAFIITNENGTTEKVTKVSANTGIYVVRDNAEGEISYDVPFLAGETEADDVTANKLVATEQVTGQVLTFPLDDSKVYYVFGKQNGKEAFYKVPSTGYTLPQGNKAVLEIEASVAGAKEMIMVNGGVTGIESVNGETITNNHYYTVDGKCVKGEPTQKGIYIVKGRKVVVK